MPGTDPLESKILKAVDDAEKGLAKLELDLSPLARKLKALDLDEGKALVAMKKVYGVAAKFSGVTKFQSSKVFEQLSPEAQAKVEWMGKLLTDLTRKADELRDSLKQSKWDATKKKPMLVKILKQRVREAPQMPKSVSLLVKSIDKDKDLGGFDGAKTSFLPMAILLWMIWDTIGRGLKARPR
jgi:hypothetical protein